MATLMLDQERATSTYVLAGLLSTLAVLLLHLSSHLKTMLIYQTPKLDGHHNELLCLELPLYKPFYCSYKNIPH